MKGRMLAPCGYYLWPTSFVFSFGGPGSNHKRAGSSFHKLFSSTRAPIKKRRHKGSCGEKLVHGFFGKVSADSRSFPEEMSAETKKPGPTTVMLTTSNSSWHPSCKREKEGASEG